MTTATALAGLKQRLEITTSTFDTVLTGSLQDALNRLAPFFVYDIAEDTSVTLATGVDKFTNPVTGSTIENIYYRRVSTDPWTELDYWRTHGNVVYLEENVSTALEIKILAKRAFAWNDTDLGNFPAAGEPALYNMAMAEFYTYLLNNKSKFNIYQQNSGVRNMQEMAETAVFYENRAFRIAEDALSGEGY